MHPILNIAICAARKAGSLITKSYERPTVSITKDHKRNNNLSINVDKVAEAAIKETVYKYYPKHTVFFKEDNVNENCSQDIRWIIDPLNGTSNFIKRLPHFAISIAVCIKNQTEVAIIYDPIRNELFTAVRGQGAQLDGHRLRISDTHGLNKAILATGVSFKTERCADTCLDIFCSLLNKCTDFRRTGSSALDLAYVAANRIDGYFGINLNPWCFFAGELIAREAGVLVCDFSGEHNCTLTGNIVAGNSQIVKEILSIIHSKIRILNTTL